jgi:hypothetical protein
MRSPNDDKLPRCPAGLVEAWNRRKLVLFLGAGISQPYGLPSWNDLVLTLLLDESSKIFGQFWEHYRVPLGAWMVETFGLTPVSMARLARKYAEKNYNFDDARFREYLREELYRSDRDPKKPTTLSAIVDLLCRSEQHPEKWRIPIVATLNFDDLLEQKLRKKGVDFKVVFNDERRTEDLLTILHIHGYLPRSGKVPEGEIVFTEDEYHRLSFKPFHWSQTEVVNLLRNYTVLFVGLSMSDPNLRRLLEASHPEKSAPAHFVLKAEYTLTKDQKDHARRTITERARIEAMKLGVPDAEKSQDKLDHALNSMLSQALTYDADVLRELGVETILVKDFDAMPKFLETIGRPMGRAAGRGKSA